MHARESRNTQLKCKHERLSDPIFGTETMKNAPHLPRVLPAPACPVIERISRVVGAPARQRGIALISAMLILVILTLLAITMFRGFGLQQKIAGNVREKQRAFEVAQNALQFGELWTIQQSMPSSGITCSALVTITSSDQMRACNTELSSATDPSGWVGSSSYTPTGMTVKAPADAAGGVVKDAANNVDIKYAAAPQLYVAYLGLSANRNDVLYSITGAGFGGTNGTVSVVQSVVTVPMTVKSKDGT